MSGKVYEALRRAVKKHKLEEALPNITMTLNYYAHATIASAKAEMDRLAA